MPARVLEVRRVRKQAHPMSGKRSIASRLYEGLGRVTWKVVRRKLDERRTQKAHKR